MNKKALLITSIAAVFAVGVGTITLSGLNQIQKANEIRATGDSVEHTITFDVDNLFDYKITDDEEKHDHTIDVTMYKDDATRSHDEFFFCFTAYGDNYVETDENNILVADSIHYDSAYLIVEADFDGIKSFTSITFYGEFYYNEYKTSPSTELVFDDSYYYDGYLYASEYDLYKIVVTSVTIAYNCAI